MQGSGGRKRPRGAGAAGEGGGDVDGEGQEQEEEDGEEDGGGVAKVGTRAARAAFRYALKEAKAMRHLGVKLGSGVDGEWAQAAGARLHAACMTGRCTAVAR